MKVALTDKQREILIELIDTYNNDGSNSINLCGGISIRGYDVPLTLPLKNMHVSVDDDIVLDLIRKGCIKIKGRLLFVLESAFESLGRDVPPVFEKISAFQEMAEKRFNQAMDNFFGNN